MNASTLRQNLAITGDVPEGAVAIYTDLGTGEVVSWLPYDGSGNVFGARKLPGYVGYGFSQQAVRGALNWFRLYTRRDGWYGQRARAVEMSLHRTQDYIDEVNACALSELQCHCE